MTLAARPRTRSSRTVRPAVTTREYQTDNASNADTLATTPRADPDTEAVPTTTVLGTASPCPLDTTTYISGRVLQVGTQP